MMLNENKKQDPGMFAMTNTQF